MKGHGEMAALLRTIRWRCGGKMEGRVTENDIKEIRKPGEATPDSGIHSRCNIALKDRSHIG
jgi:hypothetical protein